MTVHRDLKPENIFLRADAAGAISVKILDFGIAKLQSASQFTATSMALGTYGYMAPEQREDAASVDRRADLYSVSVILYEMLTGHLPEGRFKTPSEERKALPAALDALVLQGLEPRPEARQETAERLLADVAAIRAALEGPAPARRRALVPLAAIVVVGGLATAALLHFRTQKKEPAPAAPAEPAAAAAKEAPRAEPARAVRFLDVLPREGAVLGGESVVVRGRAEGDGVQRVEVDGVPAAVGENGAFEVRVALTEGKRALRIVAFGPGGPQGELERAIEADRTPPELAVSPADGTITREPRVTLRGTARDAHATAVFVDGIGLPVIDGRFEIARTLKDGENSFEIVARDIAGNEARTARKIVLDREPPVLTVEEPAGDLLTSEREIRVRGRIADAHPSHAIVAGMTVAAGAEGRFEARVTLEEGENAIAIRAFDGAGNEAPAQTIRITCEHDPRKWIARGRRKYAAGDYAGAGEDFGRAIAIDDKLALAWACRAVARGSRDDFDGEIADATRAIELDPKLGIAYNNRSAARRRKGDLDGSIADATRAIEMEPTLAPAWYNRAEARRLIGQRDGAIADAGRSIELDPKYVPAYGTRAIALKLKMELDGAIADADRAVELDPRYAIGLWVRADARKLKKDYDGAIADCDRVLEIDPRFALGWCTRAEARRGKGDADGAIADGARAIEVDPKLADGYYQRGSARSLKGERAAAVADFQTFLKLQPTGPSADWVRANFPEVTGEREPQKPPKPPKKGKK